MRTATATVLLIAGVVAFAADPPRPSTEELVRKLGDPSYSVREKATAALWASGKAAIPALRKAALDPSPEVARRARGVLGRFEWFDYPDTPPAVRAALRCFLDTSGRERQTAFAELIALDATGRAAGRAILENELSPAVSEPLAAFLVTHLRREVPARVGAGDADAAAELIALHATRSGTAAGAADFAAFHVLRDTLPKAIADAEAAPPSPAADRVLAHLYRAARDWPKARAPSRRGLTPATPRSARRSASRRWSKRSSKRRATGPPPATCRRRDRPTCRTPCGSRTSGSPARPSSSRPG